MSDPIAENIRSRMIYDENKVPEYTLPDPVKGISSALDWHRKRSELLQQFSQTMYGDILPRPQEMKIELLESGSAQYRRRHRHGGHRQQYVSVQGSHGHCGKAHPCRQIRRKDSGA